MSFIHWIQAARPKTLGAAVAPVVVGSVVGAEFGQCALDYTLLACTLLSCVALQVATNWFNDALDFQKGADTAARLGPQRITASGLVKPGRVMLAGALMLVLATLLAVPLIQARGWPMVAIGVPSLYFCFGYTGGPVPLAYRGLGELFVILFFGFVAVVGSAYVQCGLWLPQALLAGAQVGCLSTVLIAVNNLRDAPEDGTTGKRTLAVRYGQGFARWEITLLVVLPFLLGALWLHWGRAVAFYAPAVFTAVLWLRVMRQVWSVQGRGLNAVLAVSGVGLLLYSAALVWGLLQ